MSEKTQEAIRAVWRKVDPYGPPNKTWLNELNDAIRADEWENVMAGPHPGTITIANDTYDRLLKGYIANRDALVATIRADERAKVLAEVQSRTMTRAILPDLTPDEEASDE